jgi:hypothetical protein
MLQSVVSAPNYGGISSTLILLPSLKIPVPRFDIVAARTTSIGFPADELPWPGSTMQSAHKGLCSASGIDHVGLWNMGVKIVEYRSNVQKHRADNESMYI